MAPHAQRALLAEYTDLLRLSLAGNLRDYEVADATGRQRPGRAVLYNGVPAAYAVFPEESVQYAACHDNETLFDQARPPALTAPLLTRGQGIGYRCEIIPYPLTLSSDISQPRLPHSP